MPLQYGKRLVHLTTVLLVRKFTARSSLANGISLNWSRARIQDGGWIWSTINLSKLTWNSFFKLSSQVILFLFVGVLLASNIVLKRFYILNSPLNEAPVMVNKRQSPKSEVVASFNQVKILSVLLVDCFYFECYSWETHFPLLFILKKKRRHIILNYANEKPPWTVFF